MNADEIVKALKELCDALDKQPTDWPTGGDTCYNAAYLIEWLKQQLSESQRREQAAVEDMTAVLKRDSDDICAYCKNRIECKSQQCEKYSSGVGDVDGNYPDWKWTCMDFDYGTCSLLADTPCNGCFDDDCKGFEWRGQQAGKGEME